MSKFVRHSKSVWLGGIDGEAFRGAKRRWKGHPSMPGPNQYGFLNYRRRLVSNADGVGVVFECLQNFVVVIFATRFKQ